MVPSKITEFAVEAHYSPLLGRVKIDPIAVSHYFYAAYESTAGKLQNSSDLSFVSLPERVIRHNVQGCQRYYSVLRPGLAH